MQENLTSTRFSRLNVAEEQRESDQLDVFGIFDGIQKLENGWLVDDVAIELRIYKNSIQWVPECRDKKVNAFLYS